MSSKPLRNLIVVLGDQLDERSSAMDGFDAQRDSVGMIEACSEATHVWSSKPRITLFLTAMRHFRDSLRRRRIDVGYSELDDPNNRGSLAGEIERMVRQRRPSRIVVVHPGEYRVLQELRSVSKCLDIELEVRPDRSFFCSPEQFARHAEGRKQLRMEYFYREMRKRSGVLMNGETPEGGQWNFDAENRHRFGKEGPAETVALRSFASDKTTREVIDAVERHFTKQPGRLDRFDWPVTPTQASEALEDFIEHRLADFGRFQDAMWTGRPLLYHSRLSAAMNLKLIDPARVVERVERAYREGRVPLNSAEGFIRQVLGWREYVRGVYWRFMPEYLERNHLGAELPLPRWYWTGRTEASCLREVITQTLEIGYAHHIQRLMVTGLFGLLLGVRPAEVHAWYLAVYVDAVEWVELPNTLGMSQYADGGIMASKPYVASGRYIHRMSNYCAACRFDPACSTGENACPFTCLYWEFLIRHERTLGSNARMSMQLRNLGRLGRAERKGVLATAARVRAELG